MRDGDVFGPPPPKKAEGSAAAVRSQRLARSQRVTRRAINQ